MLSPRKSLFFQRSIKMLGFAGSGTGELRASLDKVGAIRKYPRPQREEEVERYLNITTYLKQWIPGRVEYARILKSAVIWGRGHNGARIPMGVAWNEAHEEAFHHIKSSIQENVILGGDPEVQYHLATDASGLAVGGVLFQLVGVPHGAIAHRRHRTKERIIMFVSKVLSPAETRYHTTEREALAVVRCLEEVRWLVLGSPFPIKVYTDHQGLVSVLKGDDAKGKLVRWLFQLA